MATDGNRERLPTRIGDRYRVERLLGEGGMASVYEVVDLPTGRRLALKRLNLRALRPTPPEREQPVRDADETREAALAPEAGLHAGQLFEREFETLSQLVHPHIIEVYDYHRDAEGPYYTMELLDGGDLRELSPLPFRQACKLLCDVCSALSLVHSRRLVHRDLTPLNIRCTRAGRAKLFDFGSMTPFGRSRHVVGTPPFVAPESLHGERVDAQTDLFALGATAYYALTGHHAYPARQLLALPEVWQQLPAPPSRHAPEVPPALDELVLWLLSLAPSARPPSAAEVMERLGAIAGLDLQEALVVRQAYLSTPILIGREQQLGRVRERLQSAAQAEGGALVVSAVRGAGRTRLLDACAMEARLLGAIVLRADESDGSARWGAARALLRQLVAHSPEVALPAVHKRVASLAHLLPEVAASPPIEPDADGQQAFRARLQIALRDLMCDVADSQLLVLVVDDVERIDEPSAALLALIAHQSRSRQLLVIVSVERLDHAPSVSALQWLLQGGESIRLGNLSAHQTELLVRSLFGEVPNVRLCADRIHAAAGGKPAAIMQIARQLVASGRARYAAGTWTLPGQIEAAELSLLLHAGFDPRVEGSALELARALAACEGQRLSWGECLSVSAHGEPRRLISELDELVAAGIVSLHAEHYFVSDGGLRAALLRGLGDERARALHARVAALYQQRGDQSFRVAQQLWRAGQSARALEVLLTDLRARPCARAPDPVRLFEQAQSLPAGWQATFRALIDACTELGRPCRDRLDLQRAFLAYTSVTAGYEPECLRRMAAQLRQDCGLDLYDALDPSLPELERLAKALAAAQRRYENLPQAERGLPLSEAITQLSQVLVQAIGMAGHALDHELLASLPSLAPLAPLSSALSIVQQSFEHARDLLAGRVLRALRGNHRLLALPELRDASSSSVTLALNWSTAMLEANLGDPAALARADVLERNPLFALNAWRVRGLYALFQGDLQRAEQCRIQTELLQIQNSPPQLFEGSHCWQLTLGYFAAGDLLRTKHCIAELEAMARQFEPWRPTVHFARGAYQILRGDPERALVEFETALGMSVLGSHVAWPACAGGVLTALNAQARFEDSARRGRALLDQLLRAELPELGFFVALPLAQAELGLGRIGQAGALLARVVDDLDGRGRRSIYLGRARELQAWVALKAGDRVAFDRALGQCQLHYLPGKNPQLHSELERLQRAAREAGLLPATPPQPARSSDLLEGEGAGSSMATVLRSATRAKSLSSAR